MVRQRRKILRCRCSRTASALLLSLFLRVKILHLAHRKFTFRLFRSNYSVLFSHFNDATLAIIKLQKHRRMVVITLWAARAKLVPALQCWEKQRGVKFEQGGSVYILEKNYTLEKVFFWTELGADEKVRFVL